MAQTIGPLKRFKTHMAVLKKYTSRVIQDRRECPAGSTTAVDILGLFLKAAAEEDSKFDHQYLTDVVLNLILAGRDTTVHPHPPVCTATQALTLTALTVPRNMALGLPDYIALLFQRMGKHVLRSVYSIIQECNFSVNTNCQSFSALWVQVYVAHFVVT